MNPIAAVSFERVTRREKRTLGSDLPQAARDLVLSQEGILGRLVVSQTPQLLLVLYGEWDDVCALAAVSLDPLGDLGQVFAFLAEIVFHRKIDEVDYRLGGDELQLGTVRIISKNTMLG